MQQISRKEAYRQGKKRYFTGKMCRNGHISERYVSYNNCVMCMYKSQKRKRRKRSLSYFYNRKEPSLHRYLRSKYNKSKSSSVVRNKKFSITVEDVIELWYVQEGKCALTGLRMNYNDLRRDMYRASIDRIDNTIGYTKGNIQLICIAINRLKHSNTDEDVKNFLDTLL